MLGFFIPQGVPKRLVMYSYPTFLRGIPQRDTVRFNLASGPNGDYGFERPSSRKVHRKKNLLGSHAQQLKDGCSLPSSSEAHGRFAASK